MNFVEWPGKGQFVPLPGGMKVIKQSDTELEIEGYLPDGPKHTDRHLRVMFTAADGHLTRLCRVRYSAKAEKQRWGGSAGSPTKYIGRVGTGGIRHVYRYVGYLMQDMPT